MVIKRFCDDCKKEIEGGYWTLESYFWNKDDERIDNKGIMLDLCLGCAKKRGVIE